MRSSNLITGIRRKNGYAQANLNEEGVFKTSRGKFVVKVKQNGKITSLGLPFDTKKEAIDKFNDYKNI